MKGAEGFLHAVLFIASFGLGMITPPLPLFAQSFNVSYLAVGSVIAVFGGIRIFVNFPAADMTLKYGVKIVTILGVGIVSLSSFIAGSAQDFLQLFLSRLIMGVGTGFVYTPVMIHMVETAPSTRRGRIMSYYLASILGGASLGPAVGGFLADSYGLRAPFYAYAIIVLFSIPALLALKNPPPSSRHRHVERNSLQDYTMFMLKRDVALVNLAAFVSFFQRTGLQYTIVPPHLANLGLNLILIGNLMAVIAFLNFALTVPAGWFSDKVGRKSMTSIANIACGVSVVAFPFTNDYSILLLLATVWGIGSGIVGPLPPAMIADVASEKRALGLSLNRAFADIGFVLGPLATGVAFDLGGVHFPFYVTALSLIASGMAMQLLLKPKFIQAV